MNSPLVSVIIPNYNHAPYLKQRIDSVLNQTFQNFELIILDDCSTDNSREIIEQYRSNDKISHIIYNKVNSGSTFRQWIKGVELAKGELIWIAESDDVAEDAFLEKLVQPFVTHADMLISNCRSIVIDENSHHLGLQETMETLNKTKWQHDYIEDAQTERSQYLQYMNVMPNASAVLFKKPNDFRELIDTEMRFCGDWLLWKNLLSQKGKVAFINIPLNYFRRHSNTTRSLVNTDKDVERKRFAELRSFVEPFFLNFFENRYDWIIQEWALRKSVFKNTIQYYTTLLHPTLAFRYFLKVVKKKIPVIARHEAIP